MKIIKAATILMLLNLTIIASEHGVFLKTHEAIQEDISIVETQLLEALKVKLDSQKGN